jgi:sugar phosphate isomerase/epimerase
MFELGVVTDEISQDFDHALDVVDEWGWRWVELRSMWGKNMMDLDEAEVQHIQNEIEARGLNVIAIDSPCLKCTLPGFPTVLRGDSFFVSERDYPTHLKMLQRACDLAHQLDAKYVRIFSFWAVADLEQAWGALLDRFGEVLQVAERNGVTLILENEHVCTIATGAQSRRLLDAVKSPYLRPLWDPGNAQAVGETPYPNGYAHLAGDIAHVHLKDCRRGEGDHGYVWLPVGSGDIDLLGQLRALKTDGYTGVVSLETHYTPPGGAKEDGSRLAYAGLQRILAQL